MREPSRNNAETTDSAPIQGAFCTLKRAWLLHQSVTTGTKNCPATAYYQKVVKEHMTNVPTGER